MLDQPPATAGGFGPFRFAFSFELTCLVCETARFLSVRPRNELAMTQEAIEVRGARVNNLKNSSFSIPINQMTVVTGVSGSGKSSLAFDTVYAEGQRRYVESLSAYARQFLERMDKPDVESFDGICPAIAIRQRTPSRNPRSTVATATEIHDYLRLLFARAGRTVCDSCGAVVGKDTAESAADRILGLPEAARVLIGFPVPLGGTPLADLLDRLQKRGFQRLLVDGEAAPLSSYAGNGHAVDPLVVVVDRLTVNLEARPRVVEALEIAFAEGLGRALAQVVDGPRLQFSEAFECAHCARSFEEPQGRLFSFNNPFGACPTCHGFGNLVELDQELVVPDVKKTLAEGAIAPWNKPHYRGLHAELQRFARRRRIPLNVAWSDLSEDHRRAVLEGDEDFQGV